MIQVIINQNLLHISSSLLYKTIFSDDSSRFREVSYISNCVFKIHPII